MIVFQSQVIVPSLLVISVSKVTFTSTSIRLLTMVSVFWPRGNPIKEIQS